MQNHKFVDKCTKHKTPTKDRTTTSLQDQMGSRSEIKKGRLPSQCPDDEWIDFEAPLGRVVYGPQYSDNEHVFRHIRLSSRLFRHAQMLMSSKPDRLLTMEEITQKLGIQMSGDWQHIMTHTRSHELFFRRSRRD